MLPGHFKIPGHSGTDFKNRKAFRRLKETNKISIYKYGDEYGQERLTVDKRRMTKAEEEKNRKLLKYGILFFMFSCVAVIGANQVLKYLLKDLYPLGTEAKYEWQDHGSESVLRGIQFKKELRLGYLRWSEGDYDRAIEIFESIDVDSIYWARKEHALLSLYFDYCNYSGAYCEEYKRARENMKADGGELIREDYKEKYFQNIFQYNRDMMTYYKKDDT